MIQMVEVADIEKTHSNPVAELVQTACKFESHITIQCDGKYINAKSLMGMMAFGLRKGLKVEISADGVDEAQAVDTIKEFLAS
ncbi:MAG: HPr family phosphocarrier protein [Lachnospira sp.]|nr:HPr family phosphocarrier protein [Lachnospira sp.]